MMAVKRGHIDLDPDYEDVTEQQTKRQRVLEEDAKEATRHKIEDIIRQQFSMEIQNKEEEVEDVDQRLSQSRLIMDRLRACIIANFYSKAGQQKFSQIKQNPNEPPSIHPTVKEHIGKAPRNYPVPMDTSSNGDRLVDLNLVKKEPVESSESLAKVEKLDKVQIPEIVGTKEEQEDGRSSRFKMKKRIVVGNVSKYIPVDRREENDQSTHKWMVYVRGSKEEPRIDHYVKKVWFFLHPSYRPNDLVEVSQPPFHLTRRGWGEFPVRVQLHFKDQRNKRVDIIHQLKLDRTYTGLQTLGSETLVDIELEKEKTEEKSSISMPTIFDLKSQLKSSQKVIKSENEQNITIPEHQTPKKKAKVTPMVNGIGILGEATPNKQANTLLEYDINLKAEVKRKDQILTQTKCSNICSTTNLVSNTQTVQISLGGVGSVTKINSPDAKGDNKKENISYGKGDNSLGQSKEMISGKEQKSAVILQGIGSLSAKMTPSQNQIRLVSGATPNNNLLLASSSLLNIVSPGETQTAQPTSSISKQSTDLGQLTQQVIGNNTLIVQPTMSSIKPNTMIVRPTVQKTQPNMLLIQTVPQTTKATAPLVPQTVQSPKPATVIVNQSLPTTKVSMPVTPSSTTAGTVIVQSSPTSGVAVVQPQQSIAAVAPQTLYYRCKDAQGNIFLVPQQLLKQVIQPPAKSIAHVSSPSTIISTANSPVSTVNGPMNSAVKSSVPQQLISTVLATRQPVTTSIVGATNQNSPIILSLNPTVQTSSSSIQTKSLLKSAITTTGNSSSARTTSNQQCNKSPSKQSNSSVQVNKQPSSLISSPVMSILTQSNKKEVDVNTVNMLQTSVTVSPSQKLCNSLLLTMNSSNGKTIVMPTQNLIPSNQKVVGKQEQNFNTLNQGVKLQSNSIQIVYDAKSLQQSQNKHVDVTKATPSSSLSQSKCLTKPLTTSQTSVQGQGQLQVTPQGLKIVVNASNKNIDNSVKTVNFTVQPGSTPSVTKEGLTLSDGNKTVSKVNESTLKIDRTESLGKGNGISLLSKEFHKPVVSSSNPSSLLSVNKSLSLVSSQSSRLTSAPTLTLTSAGQSSSLVSSQSNSITGRIGDKKIVVDISSEMNSASNITTRGEKRIICLRKKSEQRRPLSPPRVVEEIKPIIPEDYLDVVSLVRAAVKRHHIVSLTADKYQHPYCASSTDEWLSWKVGKRRASEWQRASFCRKFIKSHIKGDTFKGKKLWTTKQIMLWCRLHTFSPHYQESTLHPFGVELTADRIGRKFVSVTDSGEIIMKSSEILQDITSETCEEEEIDILNTEQILTKKKVEEKAEAKLADVDMIEPSEPAVFVQDISQKIGVKFEPTEILSGVYGSTSEDMIFSIYYALNLEVFFNMVMKSFIGDILTESFAGKVTNGRYPDSIGMTDVFQALKSMSQADFLTNSHLGVTVTDSTSLHR